MVALAVCHTMGTMTRDYGAKGARAPSLPALSNCAEVGHDKGQNRAIFDFPLALHHEQRGHIRALNRREALQMIESTQIQDVLCFQSE